MKTTEGTTQTTTTTLSHPDSFHPHIVTNIHVNGEATLSTSLSPPAQEWHCALDIRYQLPPSVFVDRYQLNDTLLSTPFIVQGSDDLEAPLEHVAQQDTWMIVRGDQSLWTPSKRSPTTDMVVDIPLHLRYQAPDDTLTHRSISIPWPQVGWFCRNADGALSPPSLHSSLHHFSSDKGGHLELDELEDTTSFVWIPVPQQVTATPAYLTLKVPVGNTKDAIVVQWGTIAVIVLCTCWILNAIVVAVQKHRRHEAKGKRRKSE